MNEGEGGGGLGGRHPHAFNLTATTHGHFVLPPVSFASRDQDGGPSNQHLPSHGKIGDCEQSIQRPLNCRKRNLTLRAGKTKNRLSMTACSLLRLLLLPGIVNRTQSN